jgi:GAF domain-containing protein
MKLSWSYIPEVHQVNDVIEASISFRPLTSFLENSLNTGNSARTKLFRMVLEEFYRHPELNGTVRVEEIQHYADLLELVYTLLNPLTAEKEHLWAMSAPVSRHVFYGTDAYVKLADSQNSAGRRPKYISEERAQITKRLKRTAYQLILNKYYNLRPVNSEKIIYTYPDAVTGLTRYYQLKPDTRFTDIHSKGELPQLNTEQLDSYLQNGEVTAYLEDMLPLANFYLEGFTLITLEDVTEDCAVELIKKALIAHSGNEDLLFEQVRNALKLLGGNNAVEFGMLPFLSLNNKLIFDEMPCSRSVMIDAARNSGQDMASFYTAARAFLQNPEARIYPVINEEERLRNPHVYALVGIGIQSYAALPVYSNQRLVGVFEVYSRAKDVPYGEILARLNNAVPLIAQLLQNSIDQFDAEINNIIRTKFTAVQPAVQWKFNEVALDYYRQVRAGNSGTDIGTISFNHVYPLYGAIDIRNSTIERNHALAGDIGKLLHLLQTELKNIYRLLPGDNAAGVQIEFAKWKNTINGFLKSGDPGLLSLFLQNDALPYLRKLSIAHPDADGPIDRLKNIFEQDGAEIFGNRNRLEEAIQKINTALNNLFADEQKTLLTVHPCYFETFRTDGVEYDLYAGQSISPENEFMPRHLEAFRIWQLRSMIKAAGVAKKVLKKRDPQLSTTQLIYVNPHPINISFRNDERHFDVEGGYNIRYQIIKKRIDKIHIKETGERLTQPGKIAVVYYNDSDLSTYLQYLKIMQQEQLLDEQFENVELEELQGVYGLKAIRATVR